MTDDPRLAAEQRARVEMRARVEIDRQLAAAGWAVVDRKDLNPFIPSAVREVIMAPGHGRADYALYLDREVVGVIEAKPAGTPLSGVEWQSAMYAAGLPDSGRTSGLPTCSGTPTPLSTSSTCTAPTGTPSPA